jgi:uncharacterized membrane protein
MSETYTHRHDYSSPPAGPLWGVRLLSLIATGLSGYLLYVSLTSTAPAGCGPDSGCEQVLDSRWGRWLGLPVSAAAVAAYLAMFLATFAAGSQRPAFVRRRAWLAMLALSLAAGGAAAWFLFVQFAWLSAVCPYCLAVHACGLLILALVLWVIVTTRHREAVLGAPGARAAMVGLAMVAVAALVAGQMFTDPPAPRENVTVTATPNLAPNLAPNIAVPAPATAPAADPRTAPVIGTAPVTVPVTAGVRPKRVYRARLESTTLEVDLWEYPSLGPTDAPKPMLLLADYTCKHCRDLHGHMNAALVRYPGQFFFTVIPVPMSAGCNYRIRQTAPDHEFACDLARLALAVWRAKPQAFPQMDEYLFSLGSETHRVNSGDVANARVRAEQLVGKDELARAWSDPWVERTLKQGVDIFVSLGGGQIPKRVFPRNTYSGAGGNAEQVFAMLEKELGVTPKR